MNDNPEFASTWKGRVLMQVELYDTDKPKMKVKATDPKVKQAAIDREFFKDKTYDVVAEVG